MITLNFTRSLQFPGYRKGFVHELRNAIVEDHKVFDTCISNIDYMVEDLKDDYYAFKRTKPEFKWWYVPVFPMLLHHWFKWEDWRAAKCKWYAEGEFYSRHLTKKKEKLQSFMSEQLATMHRIDIAVRNAAVTHGVGEVLVEVDETVIPFTGANTWTDDSGEEYQVPQFSPVLPQQARFSSAEISYPKWVKDIVNEFRDKYCDKEFTSEQR